MDLLIVYLGENVVKIIGRLIFDGWNTPVGFSSVAGSYFQLRVTEIFVDEFYGELVDSPKIGVKVVRDAFKSE